MHADDGGSTWQILNGLDALGTLSLYSNAGGGTKLSLLTNGNIRFNAYGAGMLTTDGGGNITASSDERLKKIEGTFDRGLDDLEKLTPILYRWKSETGFDATTYARFSAQNVQLAIPEAIGQGKDGFLTLQDHPLIATIVNAIKEVASKVSDTAHLIVARPTAKEAICINETCVTEAELQDLLDLRSQSAAAGATASDGQQQQAPAAVPAPAAEVSVGTATTTTLSEIVPITSSLSAPETLLEPTDNGPVVDENARSAAEEDEP